MIGKIVQLLGIPSKEGFEVVYGVDLNDGGQIRFDFATISITNIPKQENRCTYINECGIYLTLKDGFKEILLQGISEEELNKEDIEGHLFVIIPHSADIKTTARSLAGRYSTEAILKMNAGDTVMVNKADEVTETYMAVKAGNELFLVKKNR
ncbi:MAG: hypothetical protein ACI35S_06355 [Anaeroplasma sp.]